MADYDADDYGDCYEQRAIDNEVWSTMRRDQDAYSVAQTQAALRSVAAAAAPSAHLRTGKKRVAGASASDDAKQARTGYSFERFARPPGALAGARPELVAQLVSMTYDEAPQREELERRRALRLPVPAHWEYAPVVRAVANTADGRSVGVSMYGFTPYCYLASNSRLALCHVQHVAADLQNQLQHFCARHGFERGVQVVRVEHAQLTDMDGYQAHGASALLRVHVERPSQIAVLRMFVQSHQPEGVLERDFDNPDAPGRVLRTEGALQLCDLSIQPRVWESNIKFTTRFQIDHEVLEQSWFALPANSYDNDAGTFRCSLSLACDHSVLRALGTEGEYARYAPLRYLGADIETYYRRGVKSDASEPNTRVIQITCQLFAPGNQPVLVPDERLDDCATLRVLDDAAEASEANQAPPDPAHSTVDAAPHPGTDWCDRQVVNVLFHLRALRTPDNVDVAYGYGEDNDDNIEALADAERQMLLDFARFVRAYDHDMWIWYNGDAFDLPTLLARAKLLGIEREFCDIGRLPTRPMTLKKSTFQSKARGARDSHDVTVPLRINFDLLRVVQSECKLRKYTLRYVLEQFWRDAKPGEYRPDKDDIDYTEIAGLFDGDPETRSRLAHYAMRDVEVLRHVLRKRRFADQYLEVSRLTSVPVDALITQGAQAKVHTLLALFARRNNYALPTLYFTPAQERSRAAKPNSREKGYKGATVLEPRRGYYAEHPVATLDYSGLYPSIMMACNLCPTTLCSEAQAAVLNAAAPGSCVQCRDTGAWFVVADVCKGVTPRILEGLTTARASSKKRAAECKKNGDLDGHAAFDVRQLAIKLIANSVYGFFGVLMGRFGYPIVAATVTAYGRHAIDTAKRTAESEETRELMRALGISDTRLSVLYGDTDSIMVHFESLDGARDMALAMQLAKQIAALITSKMLKPMEIVWEKCYWPFLLLEPKNYVGQLWTEPKEAAYIDVKGLETKKRDTPPFVERTMNAIIDKLMRERSLDAACEVARAALVELRTDALPLADYEMTKSFGRAASAYKNALAMPQLWLHRKLEAEQPGTGPLVGDRVSYVIAADDNEPAHAARAVDPAQLQRLGLCIDRHYYETNKFSNPLCRLLDIPLGGKGMTRRLVFDAPETQRYRLTLRSSGMQRYAT